MSEIASFYDEFSEIQLSSGVHKRHLLILEWLKYFGLKKDHHVLEIGAGVGTVTGLLAEYLSKGTLTSNDISEKSIEIAKRRLARFKNISFSAGDITKLQFDSKYNVIVLPDVIEHIPKEAHLDLFQCLHKMLEEDGFLVVHIPSPYYLEWVKNHQPEQLQVIDQPLHIDFVGKLIRESGFVISHLQTYSIWNDNPDYQIFKLQKTSLHKNFIAFPGESQTILSKVSRKIKSILGQELYKLPL